jgi:Ca2+:H+ antiporter
MATCKDPGADAPSLTDCGPLLNQTDNALHNRLKASRQASGRYNIFTHNQSRSFSMPTPYQDDIDLEGQRLAPTATAPERGLPRSSASESKETAPPRPETGESSAELHPSDHEGQELPGTMTQGALRQRNTARDQVSDATVVPAPETEKPKKQDRTFFKHLTPKEPFTVRNQIRRTLFGGWINILLLAAPVGIAINYIPAVDRKAVFVVNFIAIVPLASMLSFATEEIALRTGETLGGLLNATFGYVRS